MSEFNDLYHPYARYGLAYALLEAKKTDESVTTDELPEILAQAIENGLGHFRFKPGQVSADNQTMRFDVIKYAELQSDASLIQGKLSALGKYLAPTVVSTDGDAKGTYDNAVEIIESLRAGKSLSRAVELSRSFAPTTAKINNGGSLKAPKGSLFEAACSVVTTLTAVKPAAMLGAKAKNEVYNTAIIPDLPLKEMCDFIELFKTMMSSKLDGDLMQAKLPPKQIEEAAPRKSRKKKPDEQAKPKPEYKRPRIFNGNYPFSPRQAVFGAVGLLAAIGKWAQMADEVAWARRVLTSIAGNKDEAKAGVPLYIVSYDSITQVQFVHHVVELSIAGKLSEIIDGLTYDTQILSELENKSRSYELPSYKLFYLMASRFLQSFSLPAFRDFLATRAEYPAVIQPLFEVYFMQARKIPIEIVQSARALGQWLNRTAYFVADSEVKTGTPERRAKVQKEKAKILVELESAAASAKTPQDMLHRVMTQAGRLLRQDAPAEATRFMDAAMSGEIEPTEALHLLTAYLRLRATKSEEPKPEETHGDANLFYEDTTDNAQPAS